MNHSEAVADIEAALNQLRDACRKHHIPEPDILRWSDPLKGAEAKKVLYSIASHGELMSFRVVQKSGSYEDQINGFNFEWV